MLGLAVHRGPPRVHALSLPVHGDPSSSSPGSRPIRRSPFCSRLSSCPPPFRRIAHPARAGLPPPPSEHRPHPRQQSRQNSASPLCSPPCSTPAAILSRLHSLRPPTYRGGKTGARSPYRHIVQLAQPAWLGTLVPLDHPLRYLVAVRSDLLGGWKPIVGVRLPAPPLSY